MEYNRISTPSLENIMPPRKRGRDWVAKVGANHRARLAAARYEEDRSVRLESSNRPVANGAPEAKAPPTHLKSGAEYRRQLGDTALRWGQENASDATDYNRRQVELATSRNEDGSRIYYASQNAQPQRSQAEVDGHARQLVAARYGKDIATGGWTIARRAVAGALAAGALAYGAIELSAGYAEAAPAEQPGVVRTDPSLGVEAASRPAVIAGPADISGLTAASVPLNY